MPVHPHAAGSCCNCDPPYPVSNCVYGCSLRPANILPGASVTIRGPSPATDVVCSGTTGANGCYFCSLPAGTYTREITFSTRYATYSDSFTLPHVGPVNALLQPAAGYVCACFCRDPIRDTLTLTNDHGAVTLNYVGTDAHGDEYAAWIGCQTLDVFHGQDGPYLSECGNFGNNCDDYGPNAATVHWILRCRSDQFPPQWAYSGYVFTYLYAIHFIDGTCCNTVPNCEGCHPANLADPKWLSCGLGCVDIAAGRLSTGTFAFGPDPAYPWLAGDPCPRASIYPGMPGFMVGYYPGNSAGADEEILSCDPFEFQAGGVVVSSLWQSGVPSFGGGFVAGHIANPGVVTIDEP